MDQVEKVESYLKSWEEYVFASISAATTDLPTVNEAVNRLWVDISRYGPTIPNLPSLPVLGDFQVPPPPPPPTLAPTTLESATSYLGKHPYKTVTAVAGIIGIGLCAGYAFKTNHRRQTFRNSSQPNQTPERRQVIVILGGDTPLALPLILDLEANGYIVIASVASPEAAEALERQCHGYVKALVLDPYQTSTIPVFLRSLASTLTRKFPVTSAGDPYVSLSNLPYIRSVVSLLTLPSSIHTQHAPFEHISMSESYMPYLTATQIVPLGVIQHLLPILRKDNVRIPQKESRSIVVCLPAMDVRVGVPFSSVQAMSAAGTLRAVEVMRREIKAALLADGTESMRSLKVVVVDVGHISNKPSVAALSEVEVSQSMEGWTDSEKLTYGSAFASISQPARTRWEAFKSLFNNYHYRFGVPRGPTDVNAFVSSILNIVSNGSLGSSFVGIGVVRRWIRGDRFTVGAGANTYRAASYLPSLLLDALLNLPHLLIGIRNALLPVQPFIKRTKLAASNNSSLALSQSVQSVGRSTTRTDVGTHSEGNATEEEEGNEDVDSDTRSEASNESNPWSQGSSPPLVDTGSWVSLHDQNSRT